MKLIVLALFLFLASCVSVKPDGSYSCREETYYEDGKHRLRKVCISTNGHMVIYYFKHE